MRRSLRLLALAASAALAAGGAGRAGDPETAAAREARLVATELFRALNERRYARTCALLADAYFSQGPDGRRWCELGLRVGFVWAQEVEFRVTAVQAGARGAVVAGVADGEPGRVVLVRAAGRYRVLRVVEGAAG